MKIINVCSYACANYLTNQLKESHEKKRVYYYGFQVMLGAVAKAIILVSLALLVGALVPCLIILFTFATLRVLAGGFHMDTYGKCIATSTVLFIGMGALSQYTYENWNAAYMLGLIIASAMLGVFVVIRWAPKDTPNKPITRQEDIIKFKRLSLLYISLWTLINLILLYKSYAEGYTIMNLVIISTCMGFLLEIFMVTPLGYGFFERLSGKKH